MFDVSIRGQALNSFGLTASDTISGVGLNTFGFLVPCSDIWANAEPIISTSWAVCGASDVDVETCLD